MKKYNIVVIVFNFDFEGEMNYLVPLCVHEREHALKRYETKILQSFQPFVNYKLIKHCCFPTFLEVPSFVSLNSDVVFKFNFSPCINVCSPTLLLLWGWALNACLCINALVQDQGKYVSEQTIDNYG
jgi:hypothetical protein